MDRDQVELLAHEKRRIEILRTGNVRNILDSLPVKQFHPSKDSLRDTIVEEPEDPAPPGEGPVLNAFLTGLNWAMCAVAITATLFVTWIIGAGVAK